MRMFPLGRRKTFQPSTIDLETRRSVTFSSFSSSPTSTSLRSSTIFHDRYRSVMNDDCEKKDDEKKKEKEEREDRYRIETITKVNDDLDANDKIDHSYYHQSDRIDRSKQVHLKSFQNDMMASKPDPQSNNQDEDENLEQTRQNIKNVSRNGLHTNNNNNNNAFFSLKVNNKLCLVMLNDDFLTFEPEIIGVSKQSNQSNERNTILVSDIVAIYLCQCHKDNYSFYENVPLCYCCCCQCRDSAAIKTGTNQSFQFDNDSPKRIRIYYSRLKSKTNIQQLDLITLSSGTDQFGSGIDQNRNQNGNDHLLLECIANKIQQTIEYLQRPKRLLIFINPIGGSKKASKIFEKKVQPLLRLARIEFTVLTTERPNQAKEIILDENNRIDQYDAMICAGGDGMFNEILNGIIIRTQRQHGIDYGLIDSPLRKPSMKLGIIAAGSTDSIVYATMGNCDPTNSVLTIILNRTMNIDIGAVHHRDEDHLICYTASFIGYGFFGDTVQRSERFRWLGPKRYNLAGLRTFLKHRLYSGEIKLCIEPKDGQPQHYNPCGINCAVCRQAGQQCRETLNEDDSPACILIRGRFVAINVAMVSGRCRMSKLGMSPMAHIGNGCVDLILISKCSRFQYLQYLLSIAFHRKNPFEFDFIDSFRVREFEFNPIVEPHVHRLNYALERETDLCFFDNYFNDSNKNQNSNDENDDDGRSLRRFLGTSTRTKTRKERRKGFCMSTSVWNCDGEIIEQSSIHVKIHCQMIEIFGQGCDIETITDRNLRKEYDPNKMPNNFERRFSTKTSMIS